MNTPTDRNELHCKSPTVAETLTLCDIRYMFIVDKCIVFVAVVFGHFGETLWMQWKISAVICYCSSGLLLRDYTHDFCLPPYPET